MRGGNWLIEGFCVDASAPKNCARMSFVDPNNTVTLFCEALYCFRTDQSRGPVTMIARIYSSIIIRPRIQVTTIIDNKYDFSVPTQTKETKK